jgi:glycosyltransferase involved in cell wall biosynthesis
VRGFGGRDVRLTPVAAPSLPLPQRDPAATRQALGVAEGRRLIVTAARLHPQKGLDVLVDAMALLVGRRDAPVAVVAGVGPLREELEQQIVTTGAPVRLLGGRDDVADLLEAADVAVLSSRWEGSPLFVQEALRAGCPLVATAVGGTPDLVGDAAILVPPDDPAALATAIASLLDNPDGVADLVRRALSRAAEWADDQDVVLDLMQLYAQLAKVSR